MSGNSETTFSLLDDLASKAEYKALSADDKFTYQVIDDAQLITLPYLYDEIIDLLKKNSTIRKGYHLAF